MLAASYVANPDCSFLALTTSSAATATSLNTKNYDDDSKGSSNSSSDVVTTTMNCQDGIGGKIVAVANYKRLQTQNIAWIEAVRTHPKYQNQGLATTLLHAIIDLSKKEKESTKTVFTCTIQSNKGMLRALQKVGFVQCNIIHTLKFDVLRKLPGWSSSAEDDNIIPRPLLDALGLTSLISPIVKTIQHSSWHTITTEQCLIDWLTLCKVQGGCSGYLPGLYEYIVPGPNRNDLKHSLEYGLVVAIDFSSSSTTKITTTTTKNDDVLSNAGHAILAFTRDTRITSLKSKWVCSIVAYTQLAFEVAIWYAHSPDMARRMMKSTTLTTCNDNIYPTNDDNHTNDTTTTTILPFCLVFDHAIPIHDGTVAYALPRVTDECVVLSYEHERE
jgi:hypothetical protein